MKVASEVTKADQVQDENQDDEVKDEPVEKNPSEEEMALLTAKPKMTARQKTPEDSGRNRRRGGVNKDYYAKWAWVEKPFRKHQSN